MTRKIPKRPWTREQRYLLVSECGSIALGESSNNELIARMVPIWSSIAEYIAYTLWFKLPCLMYNQQAWKYVSHGTMNFWVYWSLHGHQPLLMFSLVSPINFNIANMNFYCEDGVKFRFFYRLTLRSRRWGLPTKEKRREREKSCPANKPSCWLGSLVAYNCV